LTEQVDGANNFASSQFDPSERREADYRPRPTRSRRTRSHSVPSKRAAEYVALAMREQQRLHGSLKRLIGPQPDVLDLLQDVYLQILLAGEDGSLTVESVSRYAMTAARNRAFDWLRHRKVVTALCPNVDVDFEEIACPGAETEDVVSAGQELEVLLQAVDRLAGRCREVFILRRLYGMSQKETARELSLSEHTIEQHMMKATRRLAEYVNQLDPAYTLQHTVLQRFIRPSAKRPPRKVSCVAQKVDSEAERNDSRNEEGLPAKATSGHWECRIVRAESGTSQTPA
jgi:RNA polymerase sigma-70 factor (ECF subfamily)